MQSLDFFTFRKFLNAGALEKGANLEEDGYKTEYRKYFIVSRAYSNFLRFILRVYFQMGLYQEGIL